MKDFLRRILGLNIVINLPNETSMSQDFSKVETNEWYHFSTDFKIVKDGVQYTSPIVVNNK